MTKVNHIERWSKAWINIINIDGRDNFQNKRNIVFLSYLIKQRNFVLQYCNRFQHLVFYFDIILRTSSDFPKSKIVLCTIMS